LFVKNSVKLAVVKYFFAARSIQWLSDIFAGLLLQLTNISHGVRLSGWISLVAFQVGVVGTIFFFLFLYMAENFFIWQKASRETCSFVELFSGVKEKI